MSETRLLTLVIWIVILYGGYDGLAHSDVLATRGEALPMSGGLPYALFIAIGLDAIRRKLLALERELGERRKTPPE